MTATQHTWSTLYPIGAVLVSAAPIQEGWTRAEILVPDASGRFPEQDLIPTNNALGQGQVLEKARASFFRLASGAHRA